MKDTTKYFIICFLSLYAALVTYITGTRSFWSFSSTLASCICLGIATKFLEKIYKK